MFFFSSLNRTDCLQILLSLDSTLSSSAGVTSGDDRAALLLGPRQVQGEGRAGALILVSFRELALFWTDGRNLNV